MGCKILKERKKKRSRMPPAARHISPLTRELMREMRDLIIYSVRSLETTGDLTSSGATYRTPTYTTFMSLTFPFEHAEVRCSH